VYVPKLTQTNSFAQPRARSSRSVPPPLPCIWLVDPSKWLFSSSLFFPSWLMIDMRVFHSYRNSVSADWCCIGRWSRLPLWGSLLSKWLKGRHCVVVVDAQPGRSSGCFGRISQHLLVINAAQRIQTTVHLSRWWAVNMVLVCLSAKR